MSLDDSEDEATPVASFQFRAATLRSVAVYYSRLRCIKHIKS
jgi:hypothetical protein